MSLDDSICMLTGATGGIGEALARKLAQRGTQLLLSGRDAEKLERLRAELADITPTTCHAADLSVDADIERLAARARERGVNVVICVSGVNVLRLLEDQTMDDMQQTMAVNVVAPMRLTQLLLPHLKQVPAPCLAYVGSAFGSIGYPGYTSYSASKFALRGFSEALGRELADTSVDVVHIAPRATATAMNGVAAVALNEALGIKPDDPDWVAEQVISAIEKRKKNSVLGWPEKIFARLNQLAPTLVDRGIVKNLAAVKSYARQTH